MLKRISLIHQAGALLSYFPESEIRRKGEREITWIYTLVPSALSKAYKMKLHYTITEGAKIFVLHPDPLELATGKTKLPHVYSTPRQELCLYYPAWREWHPGKLYVHTLIPWASEWLFHYELWVGTGVWHGGGIAHETAAENG
jgi:hypothetical protein